MASDSDTEEFYDAPEDVPPGGASPAPSPTKVGSHVLKETDSNIPRVADEALIQEVKQDDSKEIIDSIIEESQKVQQLDDDPLASQGKELTDQTSDTNTWIPGADILSNIPELVATESALQEDAQEPVTQSTRKEAEVESRGLFLPSDHAVEHQEGETTNKLAEIINAAEELKITETYSPKETSENEEITEVKQTDILEQVTSDFLPTKDLTTEEMPPAKPPRQLSVEPDIVASTKKSLPARPPPPANVPPPRPPRPARPAPPPRKKKSELEFEVRKLSGLEVTDCMVKDSQPSLDLASATSGDKIVTAQENGKAADGQTIPNELLGPQRPRSNSGRELTDEEILASVMIKNLDTGEEIPLSLAEEKLPTGINPLTLHIMRRTKEYVSNDAAQSDDEDKMQTQQTDSDGGRLKQKTTQLKKFLGKSVKRAKHLAEEYGERAVNKVKSVRDEVFHTDQDDPSSSDDEGMPYTRPVKFKAAHGFKGPYDFEQIKVVQDLSGEHMGAVWTMKFSHCGRLLASAGQDNVVRIWVLKNAFDYFNNMRLKYNTEGRVSPSPSQESLNSSKSDTDAGVCSGADEDPDDKNAPFRQRPFCKYKGHTADLLDLSWSKNYFLLSSSMDKTVRLWHISRRECLCCFQHIDFVTAIAFHPRDDRYFLSGSLDGKLRLWNIPDKKVALWNEVDGQTKLITAANFCQNGKYAVIGTYDGRCIFYDTEHLKYHTQIHVRSTRGRNRVGRKITGIEPLPGENKILVTSNDSRIRLYDLRDLSLSMKYKGYVNSSSQIKASFSHDFTYIVSGSEDKYVYIWSTYHDLSKFTSVRRDRNDFWEGIKAHNAVVTSAIFAPNPSLMVSLETSEKQEAESKGDDSEASDTIPSGALKTDHTEVLLSADFTGAIKVFINKKKNVS
ncbi:WD repeat-containing protein 44 isoform X2 [Gopherus flavomarginatus]|uniref:WD repeat-containing protein 44 isoform X2 n=1 Tax=Gopherus flavomarginatus TaxID=286002 RepID=UPI0021CB9F28|nr:WD repeat-containing protein 44 isoform X2 [Gopherus flavomarginatus]